MGGEEVAYREAFRGFGTQRQSIILKGCEGKRRLTYFLSGRYYRKGET